MKTLNSQIDIFKTEAQARKKFSSLAVPCQVLVAYKGTKHETFFVDKSKQAIKDWKNLYELICEK